MKILTMSPSSIPKSKNKTRFPSSAEPFSLSNENVQTAFADGPKPPSNSENPRSKCTIN